MHHPSNHHANMSYKKFVLMIVFSFIAMYILMYAMVDRFENALPNLNQLYMAGLMTAAMVVIEMWLMWSMYRNRKLNAVIIAIGFVALAGCWCAIRWQTAISDTQFLKSMIPHHAGAVLMVKEAELSDPEVKKLAKDIIEAQEKEIAFMKRKIEDLQK